MKRDYITAKTLIQMENKDKLKLIKIVAEHMENCNRNNCDLCHMITKNRIKIDRKEIGNNGTWPCILTFKHERSKWTEYGI